MAKKKKEPRIVRVEWLDAASVLGSVSNEDDLEAVESCHTVSVGYFVKRTKKGVYFSTDMLDGEYQGAIHFIPSGMLKDITDLALVPNAPAKAKKPRKKSTAQPMIVISAGPVEATGD